MHEVILGELEKHLDGEASPAFSAHLASCEECRDEVASLAGISNSLRELRCDPDSLPVASAYFYNKVAGSIAGQSAGQWSFLSPGAAFFRRVAFASLLLLAGLGSYLVTHESEFSGADGASIMADYDSGAVTNGSGRDHMLVTLATYREY